MIKPLTMHNVLHRRDYAERLYVSRKKARRELINIEDSIGASKQWLKDYKGKCQGLLRPEKYWQHEDQLNENKRETDIGYRRRKWTQRHEFKFWTRLIVFHIILIPLGKVWIQLFSLQL